MSSFRREAVDRIRRYQAKKARLGRGGRCRFEPSCSAFAIHALETRSFPIALLLILSRLSRCNFFARTPSHDPVAKSRPGLRPNAARSVLVAASLALLTVGLMQSMALGQVTGGCSATLNGLVPSELTASNPLVVRRGQTVDVKGFVPPRLIGADARQVTSNTSVNVYFIDPWKISSRRVAVGHGRQWASSVNPDVYMRYGSGLYRAEGSSFITSPEGEQLCLATAYLKFEGGKGVQAAAAVVGGVGLASGVAARGSGRRQTVTTGELSGDIDNDIHRYIEGLDSPPAPGATETSVNRAHREGIGELLDWGCGWPFGPFVVALLMAGMVGGGPGGPPSRESSAPRELFSRVYRRRGHTIIGFLGGLFFGLGLTVVIQQQGIWILTIWNAIVLPGVLALFFAYRARRGVPYRVTLRTRI